MCNRDGICLASISEMIGLVCFREQVDFFIMAKPTGCDASFGEPAEFAFVVVSRFHSSGCVGVDIKGKKEVEAGGSSKTDID